MTKDNSPQVTTSPKPKTKTQINLDFFDALREVFAGKSVTKLEWDNPGYFLKLVDGRLKIFKPDTGKFHDLIVSDGDMAGLDWVILPDSPSN